MDLIPKEDIDEENNENADGKLKNSSFDILSATIFLSTDIWMKFDFTNTYDHKFYLDNEIVQSLLSFENEGDTETDLNVSITSMLIDNLGPFFVHFMVIQFSVFFSSFKQANEYQPLIQKLTLDHGVTSTPHFTCNP